MYISEPYYIQFMLHGALSYRRAVTPWSSGLLDVVKLMIKEMKSVTRIVGTLEWQVTERLCLSVIAQFHSSTA